MRIAPRVGLVLLLSDFLLPLGTFPGSNSPNDIAVSMGTRLLQRGKMWKDTEAGRAGGQERQGECQARREDGPLHTQSGAGWGHVANGMPSLPADPGPGGRWREPTAREKFCPALWPVLCSGSVRQRRRSLQLRGMQNRPQPQPARCVQQGGRLSKGTGGA